MGGVLITPYGSGERPVDSQRVYTTTTGVGEARSTHTDTLTHNTTRDNDDYIIINMVVITCPVPACGWQTADRDAATLGAVLASELNAHTAGVHVAPAAQAAEARPNLPRPVRPTMKDDADDEKWSGFLYSWGQYKLSAGLRDENKIRNELQYCCEEDLKNRLLQAEGAPKLATISEQDLLEAIKRIAVLSVDKVVHRVAFQKLKQDNGESLQKFVATLKSKATHCKYKVTHKYMCSARCAADMEKTDTVSYSQNMVEGQLIVGLYNPDHRQKVMTEATQHPTFDDKVRFLAGLHATEASTAELDESSAGGVRSTYKSTRKCSKCGSLVNSKNTQHKKCLKCFNEDKKTLTSDKTGKGKTKTCKCGKSLMKPTHTQCDTCFKERKTRKDNEDGDGDGGSTSGRASSRRQTDENCQQQNSDSGTSSTGFSSRTSGNRRGTGPSHDECEGQSQETGNLLVRSKGVGTTTGTRLAWIKGAGDSPCHQEDCNGGGTPLGTRLAYRKGAGTTPIHGSCLDSVEGQQERHQPDSKRWYLRRDMSTTGVGEAQSTQQRPLSREERRQEQKFTTSLRRSNNNFGRANGIKNRNTIVISNLESDAGRHDFVRQAPRAAPNINVTIQVMKTAMGRFGITLDRSRSLKSTTKGLSDTGAQSTSCGPNFLKALGASHKDLLSTSHGITGLTNASATILGALLVRVMLGDRVSHVMMYVCQEESGVILSKSCCRDLDLLPDNFPRQQHTSQVNTATKTECHCPRREVTPPLPEKLPFPATEENRGKLEQWIHDYYASSALNNCEHQELEAMSGPPLDIIIEEGAVPVAHHTPIPVAHHWKKEVKEGLDRDVRLGVIEEVPAGTPTTWCARMVVAPKAKTGKPRRTVDLQAVNKVSLRETHHTDTPHRLVCTIPVKQKKTVLDCWNGYHALKLTEAARDCTTFITEWGRYRYLRAPQGFHASGDGYMKRTDDIIHRTTHMRKIIDDTLLYGDMIEDIFWRTVRYMDLCSRNGIVFNPDKFRFGQDEVEFAGFTVSATGYQPTKTALEAIANFPVPASLTDIRSWFGLVKQVSYAFAKSQTMLPFRELLRKSQPFYWDETHRLVCEGESDSDWTGAEGSVTVRAGQGDNAPN